RAHRHPGSDLPAADRPRARRPHPGRAAARGARRPPLDPRHPQPDPAGHRPVERLRDRAPPPRARGGTPGAAGLRHRSRAPARAARIRFLLAAARWRACGTAPRLPEHAAELAALPVSATDLALSRGLQLALAAERLSPWRLRLESARAEREQTLREKAQTD